jgi:hypothetical protein
MTLPLTIATPARPHRARGAFVTPYRGEQT